MVLKLHGSPLSTCVRRVATVLKEKDVPYELVPVDFAKREHKAPAFLEKNPFGQVPYIDDDGFILFESRAIARYVTVKYAHQGAQLLPPPGDLQKLGLFERAASIELSQFDPSASGLAFENVFKKMRGQETDQEAVESLKATLSLKLDAYEKILSKSKYLAGDEITLADLFHLPYGAMLKLQGYDFLEDESRPNVVRWWKDISSRPSWQAVKDGA
ncbi:glutathione S-transferase [Obba rivulosa]|uniref:glutathione transferase n=1 Tax=Obba rivulosa TaxID=1052685 RepID=A0A8E2DKX2_9APHY|nr:glutathione S-transferase [Obba rivulosa]